MLHHHSIALVLALASPGLPAQGNSGERANLLRTAASAGSFGTLLAAVSAAGLEGVLQSAGPFTVLAPTDAAFAQLPQPTLKALLRPESRDQLATILKYHVLSGRVSASAALADGFVSNLSGDRLAVTLKDGRLRIAGVRVVSSDIETTNGVIHAIDTVLLPASSQAAITSMAALTPAGLIELAVDRGVPLFNDSQLAACAAVYEVAAIGLLGFPRDQVTDDARQHLLAALRDIKGEKNPRDAAWTLRRGLDRAYAALQAPARRSESRSSRTVESFDDASSNRAWQVVNDTVMGGRSRSRLTSNGDGQGVFEGEVSLENNGGFASVRRAVEEGSLRGFDGIELRVKGDGKRYRLNVSDKTQASGDSYRAQFATENGAWTTVRLAFADMERSVMGYRPPGSQPLPAERIRSIGLSIGDQQDGAFRLEIDAIRAYRGD